MNSRSHRSVERIVEAVHCAPAGPQFAPGSPRRIIPCRRGRGEKRGKTDREGRGDMSDAILVLNAGSSSLKFTEFLVRDGEALEAVVTGELEELYGRARFHAERMPKARPSANTRGARIPVQACRRPRFSLQIGGESRNMSDARLAAVGHRVVHGGTVYAAPVRIDSGVVNTLAALVPLAPLHQPHNLLPMRVVAERQPEEVQVACF